MHNVLEHRTSRRAVLATCCCVASLAALDADAVGTTAHPQRGPSAVAPTADAASPALHDAAGIGVAATSVAVAGEAGGSVTPASSDEGQASSTGGSGWLTLQILVIVVAMVLVAAWPFRTSRGLRFRRDHDGRRDDDDDGTRPERTQSPRDRVKRPRAPTM